MATYTEGRTREVALDSEKFVTRAMPPVLGAFDMTAVYLVAIFFIVNAATAASGGASAFTFLILGAVTFFIPCAIATAQLGHMFPHEGSLYNWTHKALGGYWSFFIGFCAWFPGVLVIVAGADIVISLIAGLNSSWLTAPWQQGLAIAAVIAFSGLLAVQRVRIVQNIVKMMVCLIGVAVVLIGLSSLFWLATGHRSVTNFGDLHGWAIHFSSTGNINLFGLITLAYLGTEVPLNMGGEITERKVVTRHLFWGTMLVLVGYFIATFALLVVQGSSVGSVGGFSLITNVDMVLGKPFGNITAICIIAFFVIVPVVYNYTFARLLMVAGIDRRLPASIGKLNKHRVPTNAIIFQTVAAVIFTLLIFDVTPYVVNLGNPSDLVNEVYNVSQAGATLVWAISSAFFFINVARNVRSVRTEILTVAAAVQESEKETATGVARVQVTGTALATIFGLVEQQASEIRAIHQMMEHLLRSARSLSETMNTISEITTHSSASTRTVAQQMQQLTLLALQLRTSVEVFTIKDSTIPLTPRNQWIGV